MKFVFWVGATAAGKSALALEFAQNDQIPILNADSVQCYQGVDIGSAKPSLEERALTPHYLFDIAKAPEVMTAGEYNRRFFEWVENNKNKYPVVFVVGGTGFYFQAIEKGLLPIPPANPDFQKTLFDELATDKESAELRLHARLTEKDPESAKRIHPRDHYRLVRALDIVHATGKAPSQILKEHQEKAKFPFPLLKIGLRRPKEEMQTILKVRAEKMLAAGLLSEVRGLMDQGLENWEPLASVGYLESVQYLKGEISSEADLVARIVDSSLKLQKKQKTWFQRDLEIHWFAPEESEKIAILLQSFES